jgi:hypothetical protein
MVYDTRQSVQDNLRFGVTDLIMCLSSMKYAIRFKSSTDSRKLRYRHTPCFPIRLVRSISPSWLRPRRKITIAQPAIGLGVCWRMIVSRVHFNDGETVFGAGKQTNSPPRGVRGSVLFGGDPRYKVCGTLTGSETNSCEKLIQITTRIAS